MATKKNAKPWRTRFVRSRSGITVNPVLHHEIKERFTWRFQSCARFHVLHPNKLQIKLLSAKPFFHSNSLRLFWSIVQDARQESCWDPAPHRNRAWLIDIVSYANPDSPGNDMSHLLRSKQRLSFCLQSGGVATLSKQCHCRDHFRLISFTIKGDASQWRQDGQFQ